MSEWYLAFIHIIIDLKNVLLINVFKIFHINYFTVYNSVLKIKAEFYGIVSGREG